MRKHQYLWLLGFVAGLAGLGLYFKKWNRQFIRYQTQSKVIPHGHGRLYLGKQVQVGTRLEGTPEQVWELILTTGLTEHLNWPIISITRLDRSDLPALWQVNETFKVALRLLDIVPVGWQVIKVVKLQPDQRLMEMKGSGWLIKAWTHTIYLTEDQDGHTNYSDCVEIYAGSHSEWLANLINWLMRYRQSRLKKLAEGLHAQH